MAKAKIKMEQTSRGFLIGTFTDMGGQVCSIQESSRASTAAIWLGVNDATPVVMHSDAKRLGIETSATCGWVPYPIPQEVLLHTRMELNQEQARALLLIQVGFDRDVARVQSAAGAIAYCRFVHYTDPVID